MLLGRTSLSWPKEVGNDLSQHPKEISMLKVIKIVKYAKKSSHNVAYNVNI